MIERRSYSIDDVRLPTPSVSDSVMLSSG